MNNSLLNRLEHWGIKGGLGILDQGIYSSATFIVSVVLANWLTAAEFGEFSLGFSVIMFFMQIYTSSLLEPMSLIGYSRYGDRLIPFLIGQVRLLFYFLLPISFLVGLIGYLGLYIGWKSSIMSILVISAIGIPFIFFPLLMRRIYYVLLKPGLSLLGSLFFFVGLLVIFYLAQYFGLLNGVFSIIVISIAGVISGLTLLTILLRISNGADYISVKQIFLDTWSFGKWLLFSGVFIALATQSQIYLTGILYSVEEAGVVRIMQIFIQPMMLTSTAFSALATPVITADYVAGSYKSMQRKIKWFTLAFCMTAVGYEIFLIIFGASINQFLFAKQYISYMDQIKVWGVFPILLSLFWGGAISLQASGKPQAMIIISGVWALFSIILGLIYIPGGGVYGVTISMLIGFFAALVTTWILYWRWVYRKFIHETRM